MLAGKLNKLSSYLGVPYGIALKGEPQDDNVLLQANILFNNVLPTPYLNLLKTFCKAKSLPRLFIGRSRLHFSLFIKKAVGIKPLFFTQKSAYKPFNNVFE